MLEGKNPVYFIVPNLLDSFPLVFTVADLGDTRMRAQSNFFSFSCSFSIRRTESGHVVLQQY